MCRLDTDGIVLAREEKIQYIIQHIISKAEHTMYLALRQEVGHESSPHSVLQITVLEDEQRRFPPKLQSHRLHPLGCHLHNLWIKVTWKNIYLYRGVLQLGGVYLMSHTNKTKKS